MGWLFAVALGPAPPEPAVVFVSLLPIALGHALSIAAGRGPAGRHRLLMLRTALVRIGCGPAADRLGRLPLALRPPPPRALRHAGGAVGPRRLVVPDGHGARRRAHALAGADAVLPSAYCARRGRSGAPPASALAGRRPAHAGDDRHDGRSSRRLVYEWLGLALLRHAWLNVDLIWLARLGRNGGLAAARVTFAMPVSELPRLTATFRPTERRRRRHSGSR